MKIVFISHTFPPIVGGVETQNYELSIWLSKYAGVKLIANKKRWLLPLFLLYAPLRAVLAARNYDVVLLGSGILGNVSWLIKKFTNKPVVIITHGLDLTWKNNLYQKLWVEKFIPTADKLIAVGNETIRAGVKHGIAEDKFVFIPNGVDTEKNIAPSNHSEIEKILGQSIKDKKIILTSGRLARRKGVAWFVENVMPKLPNNVIYIVAGSGPDKENILNKISKGNLTERVFMLGYVPDETRNMLFSTCDIFVQPNIKIPGDIEGFGISVIEAAACRLPVVASRLEGLQDAIKDGKNGFLIDSENTEGYVEKISQLLSNEETLLEFGEKARIFVVGNYSWEIIIRKYIEEIKKVIS
jgi:phosphatidylinositol alpha-1,6-mannosyltransferase